LSAPRVAHAQAAPAQMAAETPADVQQRERVERLLQELARSRQELQQNMATMQQAMQKQLADFDARITALEAELHDAAPEEAIAQTASPKVEVARTTPPTDQIARTAPANDQIAQAQTAPSPIMASEGEEDPAPSEPRLEAGTFDPGKGLILANGDKGGLAFGARGYVRYLNQGGLDPFYTDSFGRTFKLDKRQDVQLNRLQILFRGWLFDERFRYTFYAWTQNVSQGDPAQVVVGGNVRYQFSDAFTLLGGIFSIPSTRTTAQSFPNWLSIDHRNMADEYFRGSYTEGFQAVGKIPYNLFYNVAITNNLSILGVSADQLKFGLDTYSGTLYWMPTTGEYGPGAGFGDFEDHQNVATLLGVHFTKSREDAQEQPATDAIENSQIRLSDGTVLFSPGAFGTDGRVTEATYKMLALDAGAKYRGWSLDGEYYFRWVDDFDVEGFVPVRKLYDTGFQVQASTMLKPRSLQAYVTGSKIFGQYGDPWDVTVGLTHFPFRTKQVRVNAEGLYMKRSAIGYTAVPYLVGGDGWVWTLNVGTWF
jgi:hypothetical protein